MTDIVERAEKALEGVTPGPWEADCREVTQHWSCPEPLKEVVSTAVACMAYCYGGSAQGVESERDAEFIAEARTLVPELVDEVKRLRSRLEAVKTQAAPRLDTAYAWESMDGWADGYDEAMDDIRRILEESTND